MERCTLHYVLRRRGFLCAINFKHDKSWKCILKSSNMRMQYRITTFKVSLKGQWYYSQFFLLSDKAQNRLNFALPELHYLVLILRFASHLQCEKYCHLSKKRGVSFIIFSDFAPLLAQLSFSTFINLLQNSPLLVGFI